LLSGVYALVYYFNKVINEQLFLNPKSQDSNPKQIPNLKSQKYLPISALYFFLVLIYILLILTVSRSAWLGAGFVTLVFLKVILTDFSWHFSSWKWKIFLQQAFWVVLAGIISIIIVYSFNLTSFQLFDRAQSTGTGLQKITIACKSNFLELSSDSIIQNVDELEKYGCRHINLEEIKMEKEQGNLIKEIYRPDPNVDIRGKIYQKSWEIIKKHPILGIGFGAIAPYLGQDERGENLNSSNIFLEVWLGAGLVGFLAFLFIWINALIVFGKHFWSTNNEGEKSFALFVLLGSLAILITNLFNAGIFLMILWFFWGIVPIKFKIHKT
jgi:hypothetical protein